MIFGYLLMFLTDLHYQHCAADDGERASTKEIEVLPVAGNKNMEQIIVAQILTNTYSNT